MSVNQYKHLFHYEWRLADGFPAPGIQANGRKVFGTFVCGGGSAMGYKLAGYDYLGGVEIDAKVAEVYRTNLKPKYLYVEDIRKTVERDDLPEELYHLDILDGSPPCTLFSLNRGKKREDAWGKPKTFAEGQAAQTLDDLVFVWAELVNKLRPKVALMENVEGLVKGGAKKYYLHILQRLGEYGYDAQGFVLDAQNMGVPQMRRRCFIIARRRDLHLPPLHLNFQEPVITFGEMREPQAEGDIGKICMAMWKLRKPGDKSIGDVCQRTRQKTSMFSVWFAYDSRPVPTLVTTNHVCFDVPREMTQKERKPLLFLSTTTTPAATFISSRGCACRPL